jgi:hypothetical protein
MEDMTEQEIIERTLQFINKSNCTEGEFNEQALLLFRYQFQHNLPYQSYCRAKGKTPRLVKTWTDIPPVPIEAFKDVLLSCGNAEKAAALFMTSGTTKNIRGKHYHPTLEVYNKSTLRFFRERFMGLDEQLPMGLLFANTKEMPNSSLAHYLMLVSQEFSGNDSKYFVDNNGLQIEELIEELEKRETGGERFALLGASFSFVHLFEALEARGRKFYLPKGSKILDTGGFKNFSRELELESFYQKMNGYLGVERKNCINMFGMTELSTQLYDDGNDVVPSVKSGPHWFRTRVVHPVTGEVMQDGDSGVLVHCDLANFNSVSSILTEDMGVKIDAGFLFLGRVQGAEAKGCSLALEEFIHSAKGGKR